MSDDAALLQKLAILQGENLYFCETWLDNSINGVNIIKAMSYYMVQSLNHLTLLDVMGAQE